MLVHGLDTLLLKGVAQGSANSKNGADPAAVETL